jgi:hypothetical protein
VSTSNSDSLRSFFSNPLVGIIGSLASIISIPLALYFYYASLQNRELVYLVQPATAVISQKGTPSRLAILLDGKPLNADVTAAQVLLWNRGRASIRPEHVLEPLIISTVPAVEIIEASVRKTSRETIQLELDKSQQARGQLAVRWRILESGDGAVLQITFAGPPSTALEARAVIEGQASVRGKTEAADVGDADELIRYARRTARFVMTYGMPAFLACAVLLTIAEIKKSGRSSTGSWALLVALTIFGVILWLIARPLVPPNFASLS